MIELLDISYLTGEFCCQQEMESLAASPFNKSLFRQTHWACQGNTSQNCTVHFAGLMAFTRYRFAVSGIGSNNTVAPEGIVAIADTLQSGEHHV